MTDNCVQCNTSRDQRPAPTSSSATGRSSSSRRRRERRRRRAAGTGGRHSSRRSRSSHRSRSGGGRRQGTPGRSPTRSRRSRSEATAEVEVRGSHQVGCWPHGQSFLFASLGVVIGMLSISRFVVLTIDFGAVFVVQFLLLSLAFGIPLLTFFISTGQYLGSGIIDMWRISPIFQGVGVSLMLVQGMAGIYSIVISSWMFVYFRDSFVTVLDTYKWTLCERSMPAFSYLRKCREIPAHHELRANISRKIEVSIPDYFAASVLQRSSPIMSSFETWFGSMKFQVVFNLVVIWMIVFICLSKGVRSYGKVVYVFGPLPILGFIIFVTKILGLFPLQSFQQWLHSQDWSAFIYNAKSWVCAAKECFFTWSFFGGSLLQLAAHNKLKHNVRRDVTILVIITLLFLTISGILGVAIHEMLETSGQYEYIPSSFETYESWQFLHNLEYDKMNSNNIHSNVLESSTHNSAIKSGRPSPAQYDHISYLAGVRIISAERNPVLESGYQVARLATELIPAYFALLGPKMISPFWSVLFYFIFILLGISQCLAVFHTIIQGIVAIRPATLKTWEGSITLGVCSMGFILGLPAATEIGIFIVYFLDNILGSAWWVMVLYMIQLFAVLVVRGKPYGAEQIVTVIFPKKACCSSMLGPLLAFTWNVVLPIGLLIMAVVTFKTGLVSEMFNWDITEGYIFLPSWVREIGSMMQVLPLLIVPFVGIIQSCRYFLHGPEDMLERLEMLYRPSYHRQSLSTSSRHSRSADVVLTNFSSTSPVPLSSSSVTADPPPKYTPPPSYSTATGARLARMLRQSRQSIRRSMRRLQGVYGAGAGAEATLPKEAPPDYAHVIIETSRHSNLGVGGVGGGLEDIHSPVYTEPQDALIFEMRPTAGPELGAHSLDLSLPRLERRGQVVALGVGSLHRADSEAVLVEDAESINIDSASDIYTAMSEVSLPGEAAQTEETEADEAADCERVRSSAEMEAVNIHIRQPSNSSHHVLTIDMDTSSSVI